MRYCPLPFRQPHSYRQLSIPAPPDLTVVIVCHTIHMVEDEVRMGYRERAAWRGQKNNAKDRSIEFRFTFEEWIRWWENELGIDWMKKRGPKKGQFVMARHLDQGAYEVGNVKCVLQNSNHIESNIRKSGGSLSKRRLTVDEIEAIYLEPELCKVLSRRFGISTVMVECIKRGTKHRKITIGLGKPGRVKHWTIGPRQLRLNELKRRLGRNDIWIRRL